MTGSQELLAGVRSRAQGKPYVVEETPVGFDVRLALEDPQWFGQLRERRLTQASIHHVRVDEAARTVTVEDELRTLTWRAGTDGRERPTLGAEAQVSRGRIANRRIERTYTIGRGGLKKESERIIDYAEGRTIVVDTAKSLGWTVKRSLSERIGLYVGVGTLVLLVLTGIVVGIVALAGGFS